MSLSCLITAVGRKHGHCINQETFLIPVYVLTIYPPLLVLSLLENLRQTEIGPVMLQIIIPLNSDIYQQFIHSPTFKLKVTRRSILGSV